MQVIDNSGAKLAQVIGFYGQQGQYGYVGDVVKVAIKDAKGEKAPAGTMRKAVIAETKFPTHRKNGSHVQYLRNSCVLLSEKGAPLGNRIKGCLPMEFNKPRWRKIGLLSKRLY
jgi:large subunit ribosomal protein L14